MRVTVEEKVRRLKQLKRESMIEYTTFMFWFEDMEGEKNYEEFNKAIEGLMRSIEDIQENIDLLQLKEILRQP